VVFKKLFGGGKEKVEQELDIDDLIALERYDEAAERLRQRVASHPNDLHSHLRLAGVYVAQGQSSRAIDEFVFVADEYADDGFYDKGIALLAKALKMAPDASITERIEKIERMKRLEHSRSFAIEGLLRRSVQGDDAATLQGTSVIEAQMLWSHLQETSLVQRFPPDQLKRLLGAMDLIKVRPREMIEEQGSAHEALYLIVSGTVEAAMEQRSGLSTLRSFGTGDFFGEMALFERKPWPTHFRAAEHTTLLKLDRAGLEQVLTGNSDPRAMIDELRAQHHDRSVREALDKLNSKA
jgi:tetratricopeptide (TPR) repeat protein